MHRSNPRRDESPSSPLRLINSTLAVWLPFVGNYRTFVSVSSIASGTVWEEISAIRPVWWTERNFVETG
jgi:hypothetical protein